MLKRDLSYEIAKLPAWNPLVVMMPFLTKVIKKEANWNGKITLVSSAGTDPSLGVLGVDTRVFVSDQGGLKERPNTKKTYRNFLHVPTDLNSPNHGKIIQENPFCLHGITF